MRSGESRQRERALRISATDAEATLWHRLRNRRLSQWKFRRQKRIDSYIVDFICVEAGLIVELDGSQHLEQRAYDERRTAHLESLGFRVIRFWNDDVLLRTEIVLEAILAALSESESNESKPKKAIS